MPKIKYQDIKLGTRRLAVVAQANAIIEEYAAQGFALTLRQLYYQFVARDLIPNRQTEYKRLGQIVNDARLAGLIDWNAITDRTRELRALSHWDNPSEIIKTAAEQFHIDKWKSQDNRIEVWIEKDALVGVIEEVCQDLDVPFFSCRGYTSQSEMWAASVRLIRFEQEGQETHILHLGDHDPSGIDMTRDIEERLFIFGSSVKMHRLALNRDQIDQYDPPPNPAKVTDSRYRDYALEHGEDSWELDALEPSVLRDLIRTEIEALRNEDNWELAVDEEQEHQRDLARTARRWDDVREMFEREDDEDVDS